MMTPAEEIRFQKLVRAVIYLLDQLPPARQHSDLTNRRRIGTLLDEIHSAGDRHTTCLYCGRQVFLDKLKQHLGDDCPGLKGVPEHSHITGAPGADPIEPKEAR